MQLDWTRSPSIWCDTSATQCIFRNAIALKNMQKKNNQSGTFFFLFGVGLTSPGTAATSGLLYSPRWYMRVIVEYTLITYPMQLDWKTYCMTHRVVVDYSAKSSSLQYYRNNSGYTSHTSTPCRGILSCQKPSGIFELVNPIGICRLG
jgi:hypothetical protein